MSKLRKDGIILDQQSQNSIPIYLPPRNRFVKNVNPLISNNQEIGH